MKLSNKFMVHTAGPDTILIPTARAGFSGVVRGNKTLGTILALLAEDITEEGLTKALCTRYNVSREAAGRDVGKALSELRRIGALDE